MIAPDPGTPQYPYHPQETKSPSPCPWSLHPPHPCIPRTPQNAPMHGMCCTRCSFSRRWGCHPKGRWPALFFLPPAPPSTPQHPSAPPSTKGKMDSKGEGRDRGQGWEGRPKGPGAAEGSRGRGTGNKCETRPGADTAPSALPLKR